MKPILLSRLSFLLTLSLVAAAWSLPQALADKPSEARQELIGGSTADLVEGAGRKAPDYNRFFATTRNILSRDNVRNFLNEVFKEELEKSAQIVTDQGFDHKESKGGAEAIKKIDDKGKEKLVRRTLSETQLLYLVEHHEEDIQKYLKTYLEFEEKNAKFINKTAKDFTTKADQEAFEAFNKKRIELRQVVREFVDSDKGKGLREGLVKYADPLVPYLLHDGYEGGKPKPAISLLRMFFDFPHYVGDGKSTQLAKPDNLKQEAVDFIRGVQKEGAINVFDFDLMEVADEILKSAKGGKDWTIGIDEGVLKARPEVRAVFFSLIGEKPPATDKEQLAFLKKYYDNSLKDDFKTKTGIKVRPVRTSSLNHQKLFTRDWSIPGKGWVLKLTGNLTQSCIGPEGDLRELCRLYAGKEPGKIPPKVKKAIERSVPNANIGILTQSDQEAQLIRHQIAKATDLNFEGAGEYYIDGIYEFHKPPSHPDQKGNSIIRAAFTPNGASGDVGRNFLARAILEGDGPFKMANFVAANPHIREAIALRVQRDFMKKGFEFMSLTEKSFALQFYSDVLYLAGVEVQEKNGKKVYVEIKDHPLRKKMGDKAFEEFRKRILIPPEVYGTYHTQLVDKAGKEIEITAKLHLKSFTSGDVAERMFAYLGSFNLSTGALSNQEYAYLYYDAMVAENLNGAYKWLEETAMENFGPRAAVHTQALDRNKKGGVIAEQSDEPDAAKRSASNARMRTKKETGAAEYNGEGCKDDFKKVAKAAAKKKKI